MSAGTKGEAEVQGTPPTRPVRRWRRSPSFLYPPDQSNLESCLYSIINLGAWDKIRDWTDLVDKGNWGTFSIYALVVWVVCLGLLPLLWYLLTRIGIGISGSRLVPDTQFRATSASLIPLGMAFWIAFALATVSSMMTFLLQSLSDPFNWGWDLLGMAGSRWHIIWSPAIPWL